MDTPYKNLQRTQTKQIYLMPSEPRKSSFDKWRIPSQIETQNLRDIKKQKKRFR